VVRSQTLAPTSTTEQLPNPRLQRTRLRGPLSRQPLGVGRNLPAC
jgi:hypothetical protein